MSANNILQIDLGELFHAELLKGRRAPDYLAHPSGHLLGSLRHAQLDVANAPKRQSALLNEITLMTGTLWHEWMHDAMRRTGVPYMAEVNLTPWLPEGWAGTADALVWRPDLKAFVLIDFKTTKGESLKFIRRDGAKAEHIAQASAYWHAAKKMGIPLAKVIGVLYWPKNDTRNKDELIEPVMVDFAPLPAKQLNAEMARRWGRISEYVSSLPFDPKEQNIVPLAGWVTDALDPVQEREQRMYSEKDGTYTVKLMPHWSTAYCPYPDELCDCSTQGETKIGIYDWDGTYYPRTGFEDIEPTVSP